MNSISWSSELERETIEYFKGLIRINTSNPPGNELEAVLYLQNILRKDGIESRIVKSETGRANLIAKLSGGNEPPIVLISHLDVVPADALEWTYDPFEAHEEDGVIWGRGALDTKQLTIMELMAFLQLKRSGHRLNRDIYFIATADEERGSVHGMEYLVKHYPESLPRGIVVNEGGGFCIPFRGKTYMIITAGEKGACKVKLTTHGTGGHASVPPDGQAIGKMAKAIERIANYRFPPTITKLSAEFFRILGFDAPMESTLQQLQQNSKDPTLVNLAQYILYSDITINSYQIGDRINVIPYSANAEIEFRILPFMTKEDIERLLQQLLKGIDVTWEIESFEPGFESDLDSEFMRIVKEELKCEQLEVELLPIYALGRTDGRFLGRNGSDIYGFSPLLPDFPFSKVLELVHNHNEAISIDSLLFGTRIITRSLDKMTKA